MHHMHVPTMGPNLGVNECAVHYIPLCSGGLGWVGWEVGQQDVRHLQKILSTTRSKQWKVKCF